MKRREFIGLASGVLASWPLAARSQPPARIGVLSSGSEGDLQLGKDLAAFKSGLQALGWTEGANIRSDYRWADGSPERARLAARELVSFAPAVIMGTGTVAVSALHESTATVPVVFVNVTDPVAGGFVASLARPGGNMTGFTPFEYDIGGKWLELLKEMAPHLTQVALLGDPNNHNFKGFQKSFEAAAKPLSIEPISIAVRGADDVSRAIQSVAGRSNSGLIVTAATFSIVFRKMIVELTVMHKLPTIFWNRSQVAQGGLMSLGPDSQDMHRRSASYVDRILKGEKPAGLPVQEPTNVQLVINARTAKEIGLVVPPALMARADEVIE